MRQSRRSSLRKTAIWYRPLRPSTPQPVLATTTRLPVIRIVNRKTNEVVDQIPPEYVLRLGEELRQADK
ncbi:MAG: hypothetical protein DMG58_06315 [Acidobacteria bacterium]|nr:MAG: hypothetical protein DMG58_06315 [Acidobacteriota bacterium]